MTLSPGIHSAHPKRILCGSRTVFFLRMSTLRRAHGRRVRPAHSLRGNGDVRHDQRWRERPRLDGLGSLAGQDTGVVHAIVGSSTATLTPTLTAAQSAAAVAGRKQDAAIQTLARSNGSQSHQGRQRFRGGCRNRGANLTRFSFGPPLRPNIAVHRAGELEVLAVQRLHLHR